MLRMNKKKEFGIWLPRGHLGSRLLTFYMWRKKKRFPPVTLFIAFKFSYFTHLFLKYFLNPLRVSNSEIFIMFTPKLHPLTLSRQTVCAHVCRVYAQVQIPRETRRAGGTGGCLEELNS